MKHFNIFKKACLGAMFLMGIAGRSEAAITSGVYTVGATGNYPTLADALGDITSLSGPITLNIQAGTYSGTGWQVVIPAIPGASATNRLTIQPEGVAGSVTINAVGTSSVNYIIKLDAAKFVSVKGLYLSNSNTTYGVNIEFAGAATNDSIVNCRLTGATGSTSSASRSLIYANNAGSMSDNVINNNTLQNGSNGIYWWATSNTALSMNNIFSYNTFTNNYYSYIYTQYMGNALISNNSCTATGISGVHYGIYMAYAQEGYKIQNNTISTTNTGSNLYGIYSTYCNYYTPTGNELVINSNNVTLNSNNYIYGLYIYYYNKKVNIQNNTITTTTNGGYNYNSYIYYYNDNVIFNNNTLTATQNGSYYLYELYVYYSNYGQTDCYLEINNNTINGTHTGSSYLYGTYIYYNNYGATNCTFKFNDNKVSTTHTNTSYYNYGPYIYYIGQGGSNNKGEVKNNTVNYTSYYYAYMAYWQYMMKTEVSGNTITGSFPNSTGYAYIYGPHYYSESIKSRNNTVTVNHPNSGTIYNMCAVDNNSGSGSTDTVENNIFNINLTGSASYYGYADYCNGYSTNNTITVNATSGSIYHYPEYGYGGLAYKNKFKYTTTSGSIYGYYAYGYSSYSGATWLGNTWDMNSTTGTIYACGGYAPGQDKLISNVFLAKTGGSTYMYYEPSGYGNNSDMYYFNNTFHSNSTGNTNYLIYKQGGSGYPGIAYLYNNIFSRSNAGTTVPIYTNDTTYIRSDYNLYWSPGTITVQSTSVPNITTTSLQAWRAASNRDRNSLIYDPGYANASIGDLHPSAANPNAWSVNGRGAHQPGDTLDADGNRRAKTRQEGVPDLGAYEFVPTSTPPACTAIPAAPVANTTQLFLFGGDTVASIAWGSSVPATSVMRQYTGTKAPSPLMPAPVERAFEWLELNTGGSYAHPHTPTIFYKDPWLGNVSSEANAKIANSSNGAPWMGYNFSNSGIDPVLNKSYSTNPLDSVGSYTIVENSRIGIRCIVEPTGVKVSNVTAISADASWDAVFLPIGYQVLADNNPGTPTPAAAATATFTSTNSLSVGSLTEGTDYYLHVRTICGPKDTSGWTTIYFRTLITCHAPEVKITALTQYRAIAYWDTVETATKYEVAIQSTPTPEPSFGTVTYTNSTQIPTQQGKEYYVFVKAYCSSIYPESGWGVGKFQTFPTAINTISGSTIGLAAYPNPVSNVLHIELGNKIDGDALLTLTDVTGKQVRSLVVTGAQMDMNMSGLPAGVYQLKYSDRSHVDVMKINKQ